MPNKKKTADPTIDQPEFYGAVVEFKEAVNTEIDRIKTEKCPSRSTTAKMVHKVKLLELLVLTDKKLKKLEKTYEGDPTPDIFPAEQGGEG